MFIEKDRMSRERQTIKFMIDIYCRGHHPKGTLCRECEALLYYAMQRIEKCRFRSNKPACAKCPVHCYRPEMREQIRRVMRYSGPRMIIHHPVLAIWHYIDRIARKRKTIR